MQEKQYSKIYRLWHWTLAFSTIGLLLTVLLRKTFLSYKENANIIQEQLQKIDTEIALESAKVIAKAIRAPMWEWHYIFALFFVLSFIPRLYCVLVTKESQVPIINIINATNIVDKFKHTIYALICLGTVILAFSGGLMYFHDALGYIKDDLETIKKIHEFTMYAIFTLVIIHLIGVLKHEFSTKEPIISKMIHGK